MNNVQPLTITLPAGVLRWLESEARIATADLQALGDDRVVTAADVARGLLELGIASAHTPAQHDASLRERVVGE